MHLVVKHLKMTPHRFSVRRPIFTTKGPKQSTPVEKKGGWYSRRRAKGKSAMIGTDGLALHFWHSTHSL